MDPVVNNVSGAIIFKMKNYYVKAKHPKVKFSKVDNSVEQYSSAI